MAARLKEKTRRGKPLSRATINRDLRNLRIVLGFAERWHCIPAVPAFTFLREVSKLPSYVPPDDFARMYAAADAMVMPRALPNITAGTWWQSLLVFLYTTGWRIAETLALDWCDVDSENGTALTRAETNKSGRDELVPLHPMTIDHLRTIQTFGGPVFPWPHGRRRLWTAFHVLQDEAGVRRPAEQSGRHYGFHDLRRGFGTLNAGRMTPESLQKVMRHRDYGTTLKYVNLARQMRPAIENIFVPEIASRPARVDTQGKPNAV